MFVSDNLTSQSILKSQNFPQTYFVDIASHFSFIYEDTCEAILIFILIKMWFVSPLIFISYKWKYLMGYVWVSLSFSVFLPLDYSEFFHLHPESPFQFRYTVFHQYPMPEHSLTHSRENNTTFLAFGKCSIYMHQISKKKWGIFTSKELEMRGWKKIRSYLQWIFKSNWSRFH